MKTNKLLKIFFLLGLLFFIGSCEDELPEEILYVYDLSVSPESHTFPTIGGEVEFEVVATKKSVFYKGNEKTGSTEEDAPVTLTVSGEGFSLDGNKVVAETNTGAERFGILTAIIDGTEVEKIIELKQIEAEVVDPTDGSIISFSFKDVEADIQINGYSITATIVDEAAITSLTPEIELSEDTEFIDFTPNQPMDFSGPVRIKIVGQNEIVHTYIVTVYYANSPKGFTDVIKKFTIYQETLPEPFNVAGQLVSMAVSGEQLILKSGYNSTLQRGAMFSYNAHTGAYESTLDTHHGINRLSSDSQGRLIGPNLGNVGGAMSLFKLENVNASREDFYSAPYNGETGTQWGHGGGVGVYGDISKDAVIFVPVSRPGKMPITYRFVIENGVLSSSSPEFIEYGEYTDPTRYNPFGNIGFGIPAGPKVEDGYIFGDREEFAYFVDGVKHTFKDEDTGTWTYGGTIGGKVFDMNGKKYFAVFRTISTNSGMFNILDITNPAAIRMTEQEREDAGINFVVYESDRFDTVLGENSGYLGNIDVKYLDNGNVMLYFMHGNSGVEAYELVKNK